MAGYVVEYDYCGIAFLLIVLWNCCTTRQFPGFAARVFRLELCCALVNVIMDVGGAHIAPYALMLPPWITYAVNGVYYGLQLAVPALLFVYVLAIEGFRLKTLPLLPFLPIVVMELVVVTNPLHGLVFHIDPLLGYERGVLFGWIFGCCVLYVVCALTALNVYRRRVNAKQYATIFLFIVLIIGAAVVQFLLPNLLLSGFAMAAANTMLYLTIQKPGDMLDVTSGVFNRTALMRMVDNYAEEKRPFQATVVVLNHFSRLDSIMGYESLNRLMAEIGRFLTVAFPRSWAFRLSGATLFVVLTRRPKDYEAGLKRLRERFQRPWLPNEYDITLQVSILRMPHGELASSADEFASLINYAADHAMDEECLGEEALREVQRRARIEAALTAALDQDLLEIYLQPIYSVKEKAFTHAEALLRLSWQGKMISPADFIPVAEQNGLILRIDELVLRKVCQFLRDCDARQEGTLRSVGVNLSAVEFLRPDLSEDVRRILDEYGVEPGRIAFEMTETAASGPLTETRVQIERLKAQGFRFSLDDFGTGFANITQVVQLPFDLAKLDRSILVGGMNDASGMSVLRSCVNMFKGLDIGIVAEGAETRADVELLCSLGVDYIQGYYFAKPMPLALLPAFYAQPAREV